MDRLSPLENIFSVIGSLPQGHDKPVKHAIYNAVALFVLFLCCGAGYAVYMILEPFIKPLIWAVLVGSALHPLKRSLRYRFQTWFETLESTNTPMVFGIVLLPINIVDSISEILCENMWKRLKVIFVSVSVLIIMNVMYHYTPKCIISIIWQLILNTNSCLKFFLDSSSLVTVVTIVLGYSIILFLFWKPENNLKFHYTSILVWLMCSSCIAQQFGSLQVQVFVFLQVIIFGGFVSEVYTIYKTKIDAGSSISITESLSIAFYANHKSCHESLNENEDVTEQEEFNPTTEKMESSSSGSLVESELYESTFYLFSVLWACIIMLLWKNPMLFLLLPLPIIFYITKLAGTYIGLWEYIEKKYQIIFEVVSIWCWERHDALVPVPIRGLYHVVDKMNVMTKIVIRNSMDTVASMVVISGLIIFLICASVFISLQIYAEGIMLVQMMGNVFNQTVVHNPELRQLLPPAWDDTMDSILDNAYQYGREGLSKVVNGMMTGVDSAKSERLEKQVLELWDRIYQNWMSTNDSNGPKVTEDAVQKSWEDFLKDIQKTPEMFHLDSLAEFVRQNFGTLMSLLESVWGIVKGNLTLILGSFSTFLSVIFGGGSALLNFLLNVVVFLTTLFYLLNSSGDLYKPVEILTNFSSKGGGCGRALEEAVNGVFSASFKMAAFYGMWTWFIHNLFGVRIVYIPTAFATILGGVPFLGTYWACIPAVLDLWLAKDAKVLAITFAIFQFLPTSVVDATIYKEIKGGGHPYLTGLAIAGGIFCLGVEGAIMGPMILCGLYVAINLSSSLLKDSHESVHSKARN
ncbi:transmembrane protein 245 [Leptinotarsa decemlineata]|uniref:transmembrane protein 245 n=1 Tax=Leptinotarsa decemlineata TaxID=7539 RepID=UPI003D3073CA